ncbi:MAG: dihydrolipoamide acetyltransferase family protein [Acidobacteria bacterium]|nr:dihydrolipoamide acetyltransferase family protein [Acidobacteriota bacterium]
MASRVVMPKLSDTMEEGRILRWIKNEGDPVETGQALAEVETDKATVEMEAYTSGIVRKLVAAEGAFVKVGQQIAVIGTADEDISALLPGPAAAAPVANASASPATLVAATPPQILTAPAEQSPAGRHLRASPLAMRMAAESGVDLRNLHGTGPQGRIVKRDIEAAQTAGTPQTGATESAGPAWRSRSLDTPGAVQESQEIELSAIRRTIAKRLVQSKGPVPHFYLTIDVAMDRVWDAYQALRAERSSISINDIVIKATALALRQHPDINASFGGDHVTQFARVHIGMAVALDDGLITPVLRDADVKPIEEISAESRILTERARARTLQPSEYTGATFSVSNLGMMDIDEFSAIINPPEAAILAVGAVRQVPVVVDGEVRAGYRMKATLSVDHRVADGAGGARFLQTLRRYLENPLLMA